MCIARIKEKLREKKYKQIDKHIEAKLSSIIYIPHIFITIILGICMIIVGKKVGDFWFWLLIVPVLYGLISIIFCGFKIQHTVLTFDKGKLTCKQGIISYRVVEAPSVNILSISVDKGLFSHLFNYGNIKVKTASEEMYFPKMRNADKFCEETSKYLVDITRK